MRATVRYKSEDTIRALKESIRIVEDRIRRSNEEIQRTGGEDYRDDNSLLDDLDDLLAARIVLDKIKSLASGSDLNQEQEKWLAILFWDGNIVDGSIEEMCNALLRKGLEDGSEDKKGTAEEALFTKMGDKYAKSTSLRCLVFDRLIWNDSSERCKPEKKFELLLTCFAPNLQKSVKEIYQNARAVRIKTHQMQSFKKLVDIMNELDSYVKTLPEGGKKQAIRDLIAKLDGNMHGYREFSQNDLPFYLKNGFEGTRMFFKRNRQFVSSCMSEITVVSNGGKLDLHRNHNLKMIFTNIIIAMTGIGLFALGARCVYSFINPKATILFFTQTHSRVKVEQLREMVSEIDQARSLMMTH